MASIDEVLAQQDPTTFAIALSDLVFPRCDRDGFDALSLAERVAYCVDALEREVNNGGFHQFFMNSSGDTTAETAAALQAIVAAAAGTLLARAVVAFPGGQPPKDREQRVKILEGVSEETRETWLALDDEFYTYPDDLTALMRRFVELHRGEFRAW